MCKYSKMAFAGIAGAVTYAIADLFLCALTYRLCSSVSLYLGSNGYYAHRPSCKEFPG